ncbi:MULTISPECIES: tetratricopeptide repeat protein [Spirulina sp. CCY15215]|uniref:tetratricopeptide repeat protein n=1 Tax=Spirulina sp. CCY15215 TaxID=2767591 RepID=UPI00194F809F|nr:tetratricopeptide repeat protein [Spirulina major]
MQAQYISHFTPRSMSPEILEAIFVQRKRYDLAERLIELIRESALTENKHYRLLVGNRGIGKTHLISLIYHRLVKIEELQEQLLIAWLPEEAYRIDSFLEFLMAIFEALKEEYPEEYEVKLQEKVELLYQLSFEEQEYKAKEILREFVGKKTLLLLIENLNMVFEGLEIQGQHQLRAYLYNHKFCTILATSQSLFKEVKFKEYPFYRFFCPHHLEDLSSDEAADLLANIARLNKDIKLEAFLQSLTGKERVKAVHHLAGGNPRIYIVFSGFLSRESLDELVPAFMKMLDELTPYYQERMLSLAVRQRKIINFLCDRRYACLLEDIARYCLLDPQSAKEELRELQNKGYLRVEEIGREQFYELREPLLRFCLEMKKQRNKPIQLFVDFLRLWYSEETLEEYLDLLPEDGIEREYILKALRERDTDSEDPKIAFLMEEYENHLDKDEITEALKLTEKLIEIRGHAWDFFSQGYCLDELERYQEAIAAYDKSFELEENADTQFSRSITLTKLRNYEESQLSYKSNSQSLQAELSRIFTLQKIGRYKEALQDCDRALKLNPQSLKIWLTRIFILQKMGRYEEALQDCDRALELNPKSLQVRLSRIFTLREMGRYKEALQDCDLALELNPQSLQVRLSRIITLREMGRYEEALQDCDRALELNPKSLQVRLSRIFTLQSMEQYEQALESYQYILDLNSPFPRKLGKMMFDSFKTVQNTIIFKRYLVKLLNLFDRYQVGSLLKRGLTRSIPMLMSPNLNNEKVRIWLEIWLELVGNRPEFELPLRLLSKAIEYKEKNRDPRVLLTLPLEERQILKPLLETDSNDSHSVSLNDI